MTHAELKQLRLDAELTAQQAADLVGVSILTWQRWEGQTSRVTEMPDGYAELFLLKIGRHPTHAIKEIER